MAVVPTASPGEVADPFARSGLTHRFWDDPTAPAREVDRYRDAANLLEVLVPKVLMTDSTDIAPVAVRRPIWRAGRCGVLWFLLSQSISCW
ncbi:hypothetical protein GCM10010510_65910 [Streptomyces anandii JCM 4720]|nr:hypothetical protein GCM10010510_65910 [Streptomyces anandii JCM 4720]